jgi:hypothetical protein
MVPLELVVAKTVRAIERRATMTVVPRRISAVARAAGLARPLIDRIGWPKDTIERTIDLVTVANAQASPRAAATPEKV